MTTQGFRGQTGPLSAAGKRRSAQNAFRHGLATPVMASPKLAKEVVTLAKKIAGATDDPQVLQHAHAIAEAQIDIWRVRFVRHRLMAGKIDDPDYGKSELLTRLNGFEKRIGRSPMPETMQWLARELEARSRPDSPIKFDAMRSDLSAQLTTLDRYERRALSHRKFAIRRFDRARLPSAETRLNRNKNQ